MLRLLLALFLLLPLPPATAQQAIEPSSMPVRPITPAQLLAELRRGGYVLYFRHAETDFTQNDEKMSAFEDCANQRNLDERGRADARRIGIFIRDLRIPIGRVLASPYCRTVETAQLIFGRTEKMEEARPGTARDPGRYGPLRRLMETWVEAGTNLVIVSHGKPFRAVAGPPDLTEGDMVVVHPLGNRFEIVARVTVQEWAGLVAASRVNSKN